MIAAPAVVGAPGSGAAREKPPFEGAKSIEELARLVLDALEKKDYEALVYYMITRQDYVDHIWTGSAASKPGAGVDLEYLYSLHNQHQKYAIPDRVRVFGDRKLKVLRVEVGYKAWPYKDARGLQDVLVVVRNEEGKEESIRPFGTVFERDGRYKVRSYKVNK